MSGEYYSRQTYFMTLETIAEVDGCLSRLPHVIRAGGLLQGQLYVSQPMAEVVLTDDKKGKAKKKDKYKCAAPPPPPRRSRAETEASADPRGEIRSQLSLTIGRSS